MSAKSAITGMKALKDEIEKRLLMENEDYRALVALDKAIVATSHPGETLSLSLQPVALVQSDAVNILTSQSPRKLSQADAAELLLSQSDKPMTTAALLSQLPELGIEVSGGDQYTRQLNLSSSLSKSGRFQSLRINGVAHWWFKDRPLRPRPIGATRGPESGGSTDADTSAADKSVETEGGSDNAAA